MEYRELNALPASAFLNPDNFRTSMDGFPEKGYAEKQYAEALATSKNSKLVGVSRNGTWFADGKNGSYTTSYEGIGYHSCTYPIIQAFLDGPAEFGVYREDGYHIVKPASNQ